MITLKLGEVEATSHTFLLNEIRTMFCCKAIIMGLASGFLSWSCPLRQKPKINGFDNLVPRVISFSNMAAAGEKTLGHRVSFRDKQARRRCMGFILEAKQIKSFCRDFRRHSHAKLIAQSISFGNKLPEGSGNFELAIAVLKGFKAWVKSVFNIQSEVSSLKVRAYS